MLYSCIDVAITAIYSFYLYLLNNNEFSCRFIVGFTVSCLF